MNPLRHFTAASDKLMFISCWARNTGTRMLLNIRIGERDTRDN